MGIVFKEQEAGALELAPGSGKAFEAGKILSFSTDVVQHVSRGSQWNFPLV